MELNYDELYIVLLALDLNVRMLENAIKDAEKKEYLEAVPVIEGVLKNKRALAEKIRIKFDMDETTYPEVV